MTSVTSSEGLLVLVLLSILISLWSWHSWSHLPFKLSLLSSLTLSSPASHTFFLSPVTLFPILLPIFKCLLCRGSAVYSSHSCVSVCLLMSLNCIPFTCEVPHLVATQLSHLNLSPLLLLPFVLGCHFHNSVSLNEWHYLLSPPQSCFYFTPSYFIAVAQALIISHLAYATYRLGLSKQSFPLPPKWVSKTQDCLCNLVIPRFNGSMVSWSVKPIIPVQLIGSPL